jgi:hypothetical protein
VVAALSTGDLLAPDTRLGSGHGGRVTEIYRALDEQREFTSLAADGLLRPLVGDVYVSANTVEDTGVRAGALALLLPDPLQDSEAVFALEAAVWLITGGPAPTELDVYVPAHRSRRRFRGLRVHEGRLDARDVEAVGRVRATGPARTAADLCRSRPTEVALAQLEKLREATGLAPRTVLTVLNRMVRHRGVPHGRDVAEIWATRFSTR